MERVTNKSHGTAAGLSASATPQSGGIEGVRFVAQKEGAAFQTAAGQGGSAIIFESF